MAKFLKNDLYPIECLSINFGHWESATAKDVNSLECHGNFHLHVIKEVVNKMENNTDINGAELYPVIRGKINDPKQYVLKNCKKLEMSRLFSLEMTNVMRRIIWYVELYNLIKIGPMDAEIFAKNDFLSFSYILY